MAKGLRQEVIGAGFEAARAVVLEGARGDGDDQGVLELRQGADPARGFQAVEARHTHVHEDRIGPVRLRLVQSLLALRCFVELEAER